jgi:hypothetical protein
MHSISAAEIDAFSHPSLPSRRDFFIINHQLQNLSNAATSITIQTSDSTHPATVIILALTHHTPPREQQRPNSSIDNKRKTSRPSYITSLPMLTLTNQSITTRHSASQQELIFIGRPLARHWRRVAPSRILFNRLRAPRPSRAFT